MVDENTYVRTLPEYFASFRRKHYVTEQVPAFVPFATAQVDVEALSIFRCFALHDVTTPPHAAK